MAEKNIAASNKELLSNIKKEIAKEVKVAESRIEQRIMSKIKNISRKTTD